MKKKNLLAIVLVLILSLSIISLAGCKDEPSPSPSDTVDLDEVVTKTAPAIVYPEYSGADTMVVGYSYFSNKFSPFFSKTGYDQDVAAMTQVALLTTDRQGNIIYDGIEGETIAYNGTDYIYTGIADCTVTINEDDTVDYDFVIRDDLFFSDGVHLTIDDVIFSMYVLADPSYDGSSTFYAQPIKGMEEYRTNGLDMSDEAAAYMAQAAAIVEDVVVEETLTYDTMTADQQAIIDWCIDNAMSTNAWSSWAYNYTVDQYKSWGYGDEQSTDDEVYRLVATDEILAGYYKDYAPELEAMKAVQLSLEYVEAHPEQNVASIEGIVKTGSYSMRIEMTEFDATAIYQLGISVTPLHYYGSRAAYKYTENKFGFTKGDLSGVKAKTTTPMGAGAYKFVSFDQGIVTFERNGHYYKGCPKVENILFKETADADKLPGVIGTTFDVSDPSWSKTAGQTIRAENSNGELTGNVITTSTVDNLGYGYIGINADNVNVGGDPDSDASKNLRKGLATLIAV